MKNSRLLITTIIGTMALAACNSGTTDNGSNSQANASDVAARVNGEVITMAEYQDSLSKVQSMATQQGADPESEQVQEQAINAIIGATLLRQEAEASDVTVDESLLDQQYQAIVSQAGGEAALQEQLAAANLSEDGLRQQLRNQLLVQTYIDTQGDITVSDEEVQTMYDQLAGQMGEQAPALADLESQLRQQIRQQKQQQVIGSLISDLRANADVEIEL